MPAKVTQKQIAAAAGVHPSSVSLALRGQAKIPKETRERIIAAASKLGYKRDPMLGALAAYRKKHAKPAFHGVLAWLVWTKNSRPWQDIPEHLQYFEGARGRAADLGYRIEVHDVTKYESHPERLLDVLKARSIRAALLCPLPDGKSVIDLDLSSLATVAFGYTVKRPQLHVISAHHFDCMQQCARQLRAAGKRRIGYALASTHNDRLNGAYLSAFLYEQLNWDSDDRIPPYSTVPNYESFSEWFSKWKPDALISAHYLFPGYLNRLGLSAPKDIAVALVSTTGRLPAFGGIDEGSRTIGAVAVDFLTAMAERGEYGVPDRAHCIHVKGLWLDGASLHSPSPKR